MKPVFTGAVVVLSCQEIVSSELLVGLNDSYTFLGKRQVKLHFELQ
jgi:hypothetical protein